MTESKPIANQTDSNSADIAQTIAQVRSQVERLDNRLRTSLRGLGFLSELEMMVQMIRTQLDSAQTSAKQITAKMQQLQKLVDTSTLITSSLELDQVLEEVMDTVINLTGAERAFLVLRDTEGGELNIRAARNWDRTTLDKEDVGFSHGLVNMALEKREAILTTNAQTDERFQDMKSVAGHVLRSIVCIPLSIRGQVLGALYADHRMQGGVFKQELIPLLTAFANQAAIAIANARLYAQVKADLDKAQQQVQTLRIQIDQQQADSQIEEITKSDLFKKLAPREDSSAESS